MSDDVVIEPIERSRITFWWPTSSHPVWGGPAAPYADRVVDLTKAAERGHTWTYCFSTKAAKEMVLRKYRLLRQLGAPPIAARWAVDTECQRMFHCTLGATNIERDGTVVPYGAPMAFFPPSPCEICGSLDHDEWDNDAHPSEGDDDDETQVP